MLPDKPAKEQYEFAVSFMKIGDYETAEMALKEFIEKNTVAEFASGSGMYPVIQHAAPDTATALQCMPLSSINAFRGFFLMPCYNR